MRYIFVLFSAVAIVVLTACAPETPLINQYNTVVPPLPTLDSSQIVRGKQIYQQHCASCHGANAEGAANWKTPDENLNYPPPPHNDNGHTWHHPDRVLIKAIRDGIRDTLRPNQPMRMQPFGDKLSDADIRALIAYFKSLWTKAHREFQYLRTTEDAIEHPTPAP
ncbi:cytochrome c [Anaerolineae bacterium CFX7]|nr:cytochrome c [Anaerolineae bacterium CFX7]